MKSIEIKPLEGPVRVYTEWAYPDGEWRKQEQFEQVSVGEYAVGFVEANKRRVTIEDVN